MGRVRRIAKRFAQRVARSRAITAGKWRVAANKYITRLGTLAGTAGVVGLAGDTIATVLRGTKRASEIVTNPTAKSRKQLNFDMETVHDPNKGGYSQKKRVRDRAGKQMDEDRKKLKILGAKLQKFISRFQGVSDQVYIHSSAEQFPGWWPLDFYQDADYDPGPPPTGAAEVFMPYFLFELNNAHEQYYQGVTSYGSPMMRLIRDNALDGRFRFQPIPGVKAENDGGECRWQIERTPVGLPATYDTNFFENFDIRMQLYGARKVPVKLNIQIIQFVDDDYAPPVFKWDPVAGTSATIIRNDPSSLSGEEANKWNNFWLSETDKLVGNSITKRGVKTSQNAYTVLYNKSFDFEPVMTTEGDEAPHNVEFYLKYDYNKVVSYVENALTGLQITPAEMVNANEWDVSSSNHLSLSCNDRGRLFLKITGETPLNVWDRPENTKICDWAGSFDLMVRRMGRNLVE